MKNEKLDLLLKEWDKKTVRSLGNKSQVKENVLKEIKNKPQLILNTDEHFIIHKKFVYWTSVAALFCIMSLVVFFNNTSTSIDKSSVLSSKDIANLKQINREMNALFPNGLDWVNSTNNDINIEPANNGTKNNSKIVIRHIVFKKNNGKWDKIITSDIITNSNKELVLNEKKIKGYLWTCKADTNIYAVESQLTINTGTTILKIESSTGHKTETPQNIKILNDDKSEYRVYQTIVKI